MRTNTTFKLRTACNTKVVICSNNSPLISTRNCTNQNAGGPATRWNDNNMRNNWLWVVQRVNCSRCYWCLPGGSGVKNPPANSGDTRDVALIPGRGRSPGGNGNPLQYSCLWNSMDRGAGWATVHGVAKSYITKQLSMHEIPFTNWSTGVGF